MNKIKLVADLHVHTISSGHAYSTVAEIIEAAAQKGLEAVALTDHGPAMPGGGAASLSFWQSLCPSGKREKCGDFTRGGSKYY